MELELLLTEAFRAVRDDEGDYTPEALAAATRIVNEQFADLSQEDIADRGRLHQGIITRTEYAARLAAHHKSDPLQQAKAFQRAFFDGDLSRNDVRRALGMAELKSQ
jgi:hypothetical protein